MRESSDRILTTHTGSLPRPKALEQLVFARQEGQEVPDDEFRAAAAAATTHIVKLQLDAGIDIVSDGEMNKPGFVNYIGTRLSGFGGKGTAWTLSDLEDVPELTELLYGGPGGTHINMPMCQGEVTYVGQSQVREDIENLRTALAAASAQDTEAFIPAASPGCITSAAENVHYLTYDAYLDAVAEAMRVEYEAIIEAGFVLQLDCPDIPMAGHTKSWKSSIVEEMGYDRYVALHLDALNNSIAGLPTERIRMHLCWGSYAGPHTADLPLEALIEQVFSAAPSAVSFEAANPRHEHEWETLAQIAIPEDKILIPGVIDVKTNVVEHPRLVSQRIERYAGIVGRERVIPGTDCGFATFAGMGVVVPEVTWLKLAALAEGAADASRRLWGKAATVA
jgi:5-methyltetrahydropteroyltriglutamate--homocysteine methyltransferase